MIDQFQLQKLIDLPIESVASRLGLEVNRHKALCPFHQDSHPSLSFNVSKNRYRCYVCGAYGRTIDLAMQILGKSFIESCRWLAEDSNIILEQWKPADKPQQKVVFDSSRYERYFVHPYLSDAARNFLFSERHLDPRVIRYCRLTSWRDKQGIDWLQIPYYSIDGQLTGIQNRNLDYGKESLNPKLSTLNQVGEPVEPPRFRFPRGSKCGIYNLPVLSLLKPHEPLYIAEGASDCWSLLSSGHKAIAIPSATLLTPDDLKVLSSLNIRLSTEFHMFPDNDEPGQRLYQELLTKLTIPSSLNPQPSTFIRHDLPTGCKDYSDYYLKEMVFKP